MKYGFVIGEMQYNKQVRENKDIQSKEADWQIWKYSPCAAPSRQHSGNSLGCLGSSSSFMETLFPRDTEPELSCCNIVQKQETTDSEDVRVYQWRFSSWSLLWWVFQVPAPKCAHLSHPALPRTLPRPPQSARTGCGCERECSKRQNIQLYYISTPVRAGVQLILKLRCITKQDYSSLYTQTT